MSQDDQVHDTPGPTIGAAALGVAPLPFLAVYAVLFIARGGFRPVNPPDITTTAHGELGAGVIAAALFVIGMASVFMLVGGTRRWLFTVCQLATLGVSIYFVSDSTSGPMAIPVLLIITTVAALVLTWLPASTRFFDHHRSERRDLRRLSEPSDGAVDVR